MSSDDLQIKIYEELVEVRDAVYSVKADIRAIQTDLAYHIRRTDILEGRFETLDKDVTRLRGFFTISGWIVAIVATILTVLKHLGAI